MTTPRLFVAPAAFANERVYLDRAAHQYLVTVLRLGVGDEVTILDGAGGMYPATIALVGKREVVCDLGVLEAAPGEPEREVHLWCAVLKGERMDWMVQKATELGVAAIHLLETERTIVRGADGKVGRWRKIAREAAEQSERGRIPMVGDPRPLVGRSLPLGAFYCAERRHDIPGLRVLTAEIVDEPIHVMIGPEGGWTDAECKLLSDSGVEAVSLGSRILRAETAALAALAILLLP